MAESTAGSATGSDVNAGQPIRALLIQIIPALVIGVVSSLLLLAVVAIAEWLEQLLWTSLPQALGIANPSGWTLAILTLTGVVVGLIVWKMPGHAGPDPATTGLVEAPLPLTVLPSLLLALIIMLAGGVSLGPENPIMAVNTGLVFALGSRIVSSLGAPVWVGLSSAAMIGAMFGTPVAAALLLSEAVASDSRLPLWDRLFGPLIAAGAGALTTDLLSPSLSFSVSVAPYPGPHLIDLLTGSGVAVAAALLGLVAVYLFPHTHRLFYRIRNPLLMVTLGGVVLGILGIIGGPVTLFKGLDEMKELALDAAEYTAAGLALVVLVKLAALLIAASSGFRGGRIFPAAFIGVAIGLCANALFPAIPAALAVSCGVLGILLAVARQGWLSLFMAAVVIPDTRLLPILCLVSLPAWLVVTGRPQMLLKPDPDANH